jgi:hypothetical protein
MLPDYKKQINEKPAKKIVSNKVKDYGNDPFFVKKTEKSKAFLEKHGFPKELLAKKVSGL